MNRLFRDVELSAPFAGLLFVLAVLTGCGTTGGYAPGPANPNAEPSVSENLGDGSSDILRPGDVVIINFSGVVDPPPQVQDRITEDGFITLPYLPPIKAADHTRAQLQEIIRTNYVPKIYLRLNVAVNLDVRFFYVSGQVNREGNYTYVGGMTVLKAIAAAGGFTDFARKTRVQVTRATGKVEIINCERVQNNPRKYPDPPIFPDDRIFVRRRVI